jgi:hypothetical protein
MVEANTISLVLAVCAIGGVLTTIPFGLAAINYRQRDNGLAFLLLVAGVGVWNLMFVAQLLSPDPIIGSFFLALSVVGAVQSGLGWLLFASTASSTINVLRRRDIYAAVSILSGIDIVLAVTAPVHTFYWEIPSASAGAQTCAAVQPELGYWLHTGLLVVLFGAGTALFTETWVNQPESAYPRAYTIAGSLTIVAIIGGNLIAPGGFGVASIIAVSLTSIGWLQASRGHPLAWLRA